MTSAPYPRFISSDIEELFIHWLQFDKYHEGFTLKDTVAFCCDCYFFKDCIDFGVMKQLDSLLQTWEKKLKYSNISSLLVGFMKEDEARFIFENVKCQKSVSSFDDGILARNRIEQMFLFYFNSITHKDLLEISIDSGHYLPFITNCVAQFKALSVRYNELIMSEFKENLYYMVAFVLLNFHLNGLIAFSPAVVKLMWGDIFCESIIAWFYINKYKNDQTQFFSNR